MMAGGAVVSSGGGLSLGVWDVLGRSVDALGGEGSGEEGTEMLVKWTSSPLMFFSGSCVYLLLVMLLRKAMLARREGAYKLAGAMRVYNVMQVLLNLNLLLRMGLTTLADMARRFAGVNAEEGTASGHRNTRPQPCCGGATPIQVL